MFAIGNVLSTTKLIFFSVAILPAASTDLIVTSYVPSSLNVNCALAFSAFALVAVI